MRPRVWSRSTGDTVAASSSAASKRRSSCMPRRYPRTSLSEPADRVNRVAPSRREHRSGPDGWVCMRIEIWSDVVCPWCYIGKRRFEQALSDFAHREEVEVVYRSFELDPRAPEQGTESVVETLGRKYGGGPVAGRRMVDQ